LLLECHFNNEESNKGFAYVTEVYLSVASKYVSSSKSIKVDIAEDRPLEITSIQDLIQWATVEAAKGNSTRTNYVNREHDLER
jgi:hypothetical protein